MSATFSKAEHTVINVGEEECPRLVCVHFKGLQDAVCQPKTNK